MAVLGPKACSGSTGIAELVLNLDITWKQAVSFTTQLLYLRDKKLLYLLNRRLGGPESQSAHCREDKFSCPCPKSNSRSSSPYCQLTITCLPYVCNLTVINCTSTLHVYCSLDTCLPELLTCAASNQPLTREVCSESYASTCVCVCVCVCGGQTVTGTVFPHKNLHFPVVIISKLAYTHNSFTYH